MQQRLFKYSEKDERHRGAYKTLRNDVSAFDEAGNIVGVIFKTATPFDTPKRMEALVKWVNEAFELKRLHPLLIIAIFIVLFLEIHPFQDGNGRLSRVLTTLLLLKAGYIYVPYASLENVIENSKEKYYVSLRKTQKTLGSEAPNWQPWLLYFMGALRQQKRHLSQKIDREQRALNDLSTMALNILDYVRQHGRVTNRDMVREANANPNTLKMTFSALVDKGLLVRRGGGRSTWYALP